MIRKRQRHNPFLLASLVVTVVGIVVARAQEPASPPAGESLVVDQHGPTIKDAYKDYFFIGTAGDLPSRYSDEELDLVKETLQLRDAGKLHEAGPDSPERGYVEIRAA